MIRLLILGLAITALAASLAHGQERPLTDKERAETPR